MSEKVYHSDSFVRGWLANLDVAGQNERARREALSPHEQALLAIVDGVLKDHPEIMREALKVFVIHGGMGPEGSVID